MHTQQETFNIIVNHLRKQGHPAKAVFKPEDGTAPICAYRGTNGDMCAIGCIIPDDLYNESIEGLAFSEVMDRDKRIHDFVTNEHPGLLKYTTAKEDRFGYHITRNLGQMLQSAHDVKFTTHGMLEEDLASIAKKFNLQLPPVT